MLNLKLHIKHLQHHLLLLIIKNLVQSNYYTIYYTLFPYVAYPKIPTIKYNVDPITNPRNVEINIFLSVTLTMPL